MLLFPMFALVCAVAVYTITAEIIILYLQKTYKLLSRIFGSYAFYIHGALSLINWCVLGTVVIMLQYEQHPQFNFLPSTLWVILLLVGILISSLAFAQLGLRRSLHINFYQLNIPTLRTEIYLYLKNPEYTGFWMILIGLTMLTQSWYNLLLTIFIIILMIPLQVLENSVLT